MMPENKFVKTKMKVKTKSRIQSPALRTGAQCPSPCLSRRGHAPVDFFVGQQGEKTASFLPHFCAMLLTTPFPILALPQLPAPCFVLLRRTPVPPRCELHTPCSPLPAPCSTRAPQKPRTKTDKNGQKWPNPDILFRLRSTPWKSQWRFGLYFSAVNFRSKTYRLSVKNGPILDRFYPQSPTFQNSHPRSIS